MSIKILGIGRCIIGHLKKEIEEKLLNQITIDHHYALNFLPALLTDTDPGNAQNNDFIKQIDNNCHTRPALNEQLNWLNKVPSFQHIVLEIFPPAELLINKDKNIYCSVENVSDCLLNYNFQPYKKPLSESRDIETYIKTITNTINEIYQRNPSINIILLNGEYYRKDNDSTIGNPLLSDMIVQLKNMLEIQFNNKPAFINMPVLLESLSDKQYAYIDTEFPYQYIRHTPELDIISISRDCKHASYALRTHLLCEFLNQIEQNKNTLVSPFSDDHSKLHNSLNQRADEFLKKIDINHIGSMDARALAQTLEYSEISQHKYESEIQFYIQLFSQAEFSDQRLKSDLYKMRSISAYLLIRKNNNFCSNILALLNTLLEIPHSVINQQIEFALLWLKNLSLVMLDYKINHVIETTEHLSQINSFIERYEAHDILNHYETSKQIIKKFKRNFN